MVFGKSDPSRSNSAFSFASPSQTEPQESEPIDPTAYESADDPQPGEEAVEIEVATEEEASREPGGDTPTLEAGNPPADE